MILLCCPQVTSANFLIMNQSRHIFNPSSIIRSTRAAVDLAVSARKLSMIRSIWNFIWKMSISEMRSCKTTTTFKVPFAQLSFVIFLSARSFLRKAWGFKSTKKGLMGIMKENPIRETKLQLKREEGKTNHISYSKINNFTHTDMTWCYTMTNNEAQAFCRNATELSLTALTLETQRVKIKLCEDSIFTAKFTVKSLKWVTWNQNKKHTTWSITLVFTIWFKIFMIMNTERLLKYCKHTKRFKIISKTKKTTRTCYGGSASSLLPFSCSCI